MSLSLTTQNIIDHRASRKASGLVGCITGRPEPEFSPFGYSDVQSWRPADAMNPHCFCFDCRELWDSDATIDLELIKQGNKMAIWTYADILPADLRSTVVKPEPARVKPDLALPMRSNGGGLSMMPDLGYELSPYTDDGPVPLSLPKPTPRDLLNETDDQRLKMDLAILRGKLHSDLVVTMDKRRMATCMPDAERTAYLANLRDEKDELWRKVNAIDVLLG